MRIGELAERTGVSVRALRYYEEQHLLASDRTASGQRVYRPGAVERVLLLRKLLAAGLSSATIARVLPCVDAPSAEVTADTVATMREQHDRIQQQIDDLVSARDQLAFLIAGTSRYLTESYGTQAVPA